MIDDEGVMSKGSLLLTLASEIYPFADWNKTG